MRLIYLFVILFFAITNVFAQEVENLHRYELAWKARLANDHFINETDSANLVRSSIGLRGGVKLLSTLSMIADFNFYWSTGRAQSWYGADGYTKGINFNQALVEFVPTDVLDFQAGAISLAYLNSPLLVSSGPFPGVYSGFHYENSKFEVIASGLYSIPTSRSLNSDRIEKEAEPTFTALNLLAKTGKEFDLLSLHFNVTFFEYKNLPAKVAYESSFKGNSVVVNTDADSYFFYHYKGFSGTMGGELTFFDRYKLSLDYTYLTNNEGPSTGNRAEMLQCSLEIPYAEHLFTPFVEIFYNEADASVAYYNSTMYGNNNRKGYSIGLTYDHNNIFTVKARFTDADLVTVNNAISSRNQLLFIGLETYFVSLL